MAVHEAGMGILNPASYKRLLRSPCPSQPHFPHEKAWCWGDGCLRLIWHTFSLDSSLDSARDDELLPGRSSGGLSSLFGFSLGLLLVLPSPNPIWWELVGVVVESVSEDCLFKHGDVFPERVLNNVILLGRTWTNQDLALKSGFVVSSDKKGPSRAETKHTKSFMWLRNKHPSPPFFFLLLKLLVPVWDIGALGNNHISPLSPFPLKSYCALEI